MNKFIRVLAGAPFLFSGNILQGNNNDTAKHTLPNVVLIFAGDLGSYGATQYKTLNLDRLANQGVRFTSFYTSQAVCSASRAALLTGCYSNRVGISGALNPNSEIGLNNDEETIAEILKKKDYKTSAIGKWPHSVRIGQPKIFIKTLLLWQKPGS